MAIDLTIARNHLEAWLAAELAVSTGQSYSISNRRLERANLAEIRQQIDYWRREVDRLEGNRRGSRVFRAIPRDL